MNRSSQHSAIILRVMPVGEIHAAADILTSEYGMMHVMAYGARSRRGSLRGRVIPFARGTIFLYTEPRRETSKVTDFDVSGYALAMRQDLAAYYHASLWAEVVWKTHASGEMGGAAYDLLYRGLDLLEEPASGTGDERRSRIQLLSAILLWRYLAILGLQPDVNACSAGDRPLEVAESRFYNRREGTLVSREWADPEMVAVPSGTVRLLNATREMELARTVDLPVTPQTLAATRGFVFSAVQDAVEAPLNTLRVASRYL